MFPSFESVIVRGGYRVLLRSRLHKANQDHEERINAEGSQILHTKAPLLTFNS